MYLDFFTDVLFPPACLGCSKDISSGALCSMCKESVKLFKTLFCGTCNARLPELKRICHLNAPYILGTATQYDDIPVQRLVRGLKFHGIKAAATPLSQWLITYVRNLKINVQGFSVVPMPLSKQRYRSRGFNQSELIAGHFAKEFGLSLEKNLLIRTLNKKPQSETSDLLERKDNIHGCFSLSTSGKDLSATAAINKNIILVDDVTTSGTTFLETACVLKAGGVRRIIALAVAQA